jgi:hypothetical protein
MFCGEVPFLDNRVRPDGLHEILFCQNPVRMLDEVKQDVEGFRCDGNERPVARERTSPLVQYEPPEPVLVAHCHLS